MICNIADYPNYHITSKGDVINTTTGKRLAINPNKGNGYPQVSLWKRNKGKNHYIHRLLAIAYIPNPDNLPEVNHINSDRSDYSLENLEWVSSRGNSIHAVKAGARAHIPRMKDEDVHAAFNLFMQGNSYKAVSEMLDNSWQSGFLSVKVKKYAASVGRLDDLNAEIARQRHLRSVANGKNKRLTTIL